MKTFKIFIYNDCNILIDSKLIQAKNENEAVLLYIKNAILYSGDTLKVEEL